MSIFRISFILYFLKLSALYRMITNQPARRLHTATELIERSHDVANYSVIYFFEQISRLQQRISLLG